MPKGNRLLRSVIRSMWLNWVITLGAIVLPIAFALFVQRNYIPLICLVEIYALVVYSRSTKIRGGVACTFLIRMAVRILIPATVIMLAIDILCTDLLIKTVIHFRIYNQEIPFIISLVMAPVTAVVCTFTLLTGVLDSRCHECRRNTNFYAGDSIIGTAYYREARYQTIMLLVLSVVVGAVEYWYYFARYINSNINAPDRFFFIYLPLAVFVISLVVMGSRYFNLYALFLSLEDSRPERDNTTRVRYLVFCESDLLLHQNDRGLWDTPVETIMGARKSIGEEEARLLFTELTDVQRFNLRYLFTNDDMAAGANTIHFAVFVDAEGSVQVGSEEDRWFNAYMLDNGLQTGALADTLASELYRIHTITMAWKTYDRRGHRLYPIKHYRPTFRFSDLPEWEVDYDDTSWFRVADNNEDRHFFRVRKFWHRITEIFSHSTNRQAQ